MKVIDLTQVEEASEYKNVIPGGYICKITFAEDVAAKEYLKIEYDIVDGEFKNYYGDLMASQGFWGGSFIKSYKEKALPFFKGFITSVENSNRNFKFANDEKSLEGKFVGLVLSEEEYEAKDKTIKTRLYVSDVHSIDKIKSKDFKIKEKKLLGGAARPQANAQVSNLPIPTQFEEVLGVGEDGNPLPF